MQTVWGANCGLATIGSVRLVLEPKPGLPTDPDDPRAFIDIFTDISGLFVINNESGWYEGWMIHDLAWPPVAPPTPDGHAQFGTITRRTPRCCARWARGNNVPGNSSPSTARRRTCPSASDHFPDRSDECRAAAAQHGRVQLPAAVRLPTATGSSITRPTGSTRSTSCRSPAGSRTGPRPIQPTPFEDGEIGLLSRSFPETRRVITTAAGRRRLATIRTYPRDPDKFDAEDDSNVSFASASSRAGSRARSSSTSSSGSIVRARRAGPDPAPVGRLQGGDGARRHRR